MLEIMWLHFENIWFQRMYKVKGMFKPHPVTNKFIKCIDILLAGNVQITLWQGTETYDKFLEWWQSLEKSEKYSWTTQLCLKSEESNDN